MKLQRLLSLTRQAVDEFHMIEEGDKIAVGISGGKDSLTLLYALSYLQRFYPKHFTIEAITVIRGTKDLISRRYRRSVTSWRCHIRSCIHRFPRFCLRPEKSRIHVRCVRSSARVPLMKKRWSLDVIRLPMRITKMMW